MNLDDFHFSDCDVRDLHTCDAANEQDGIDTETACELYACKESRCVLGPRDGDGDGEFDAKTCGGGEHAAVDPKLKLDCDDTDPNNAYKWDEACDGHDNNCNGIIDDDAPPQKPILETDFRGHVEQVSFSSNPNAPAEIAATISADEMFSTLHFSATPDGISDGEPLFADTAPMQSKAPTCAVAAQDHDETCNFKQVTIAATPKSLIFAAIQAGRCNLGQLRVGIADAGAPLENDSHTSESNVALGIDVDADSGCTKTTACPGAHDPAIAVLPGAGGEPDQALALWLAPDGNCAPGGEARVAALGLFVARDSNRKRILIGTGNGHAGELGPSSDTGAPALVAFSGADAPGYFVAFPTRKQVRLLFVPRLSDRNALPESVATAIDDSDAGHVALTANASVEDTLPGLAVAYRSNVGGAPVIMFSRLQFERHDPKRGPHIEPAKTPISIDVEGEILAGPVLAYADTGFTDPDSALAPGGWLIVWTERARDDDADVRLMAARIFEADVPMIHPIEVARGVTGEPFIYSDEPPPSQRPSLHYGYVSEQKLRIGEVTCSPDP